MAEEKPKRSGMSLTTGSSVQVRSGDKGEDPLVTTGTFRGYVGIGSGDQALSIELDDTHGKEAKGRIRLIPAAMVLSIDILHAAKPEEEKKVPEQVQVYFG
ncbi:MAG: hypothetical protein KGJ23_02950 [Euryarchaeota archaeon]|nr:hypothetical protein [Euryarchaeota archaeon]MDE1835557.1 hypothetical protein [Euryarchaeota archaeon]MDE1879648.1 hypothetical protein [Euryarchaeota archaeon]MDE2043821.1 hypothetical protein [Thermoplasmata archaeon]